MAAEIRKNEKKNPYQIMPIEKKRVLLRSGTRIFLLRTHIFAHVNEGILFQS